MKHKYLSLVMVAAPLLAAPSLVHADCFAESSPWTVRVGVHNIDPTGGSSQTAAGDIQVKSKIGPTLNLDYRVCHNVTIDILGAIPFTHDIKLNGQEVGTTRHLPPTVTIQYHPLPDATFDPFVGAGVNRTFFFNESLSNGPNLQLSNTWGYTVQGGVDWKFAPTWVAGVDIRYIQIEPDASVGGTPIGKVKINPLAYGINVGYRF